MHLLCGIVALMLITESPTVTRTLTLEQVTVLDGAEIPHQPGDVFGLPAGTYQKLTIKNFVGSREKPITFINEGGLVEINNTEHKGGAIDIRGCKYFRLTGSGPVERDGSDPYAVNCGFRLATHGRRNKLPHTINAIDKCSSLEIDHVEIFGAGFAGMNIKDEVPDVTRDEHVMRNISIHDNYVHDTDAEGFYIGHTFFFGYDPKKEGKLYMPHVIEGLRLYNNVTLRTGCEGVQIGSVVKDGEMYNNTILDTGIKPFMQWQDNGVQIGSGFPAEVHHNFIQNTPTRGLLLFGIDSVHAYENVIVDAHTWGIYLHAEYADRYIVENNTVVTNNGQGFFIDKAKNPDGITFNDNLIIDTTGSEAAQVYHIDDQPAGYFAEKNPLIHNGAPLPKGVGASWFKRGETVRAPLATEPPRPWAQED